MSRTDAEVTRAADQTARTILRLLSERNAAEVERDMALEMHEVQYERANRVTRERDRARDIAAALEAQLAAVGEALTADPCRRRCRYAQDLGAEVWASCADGVDRCTGYMVEDAAAVLNPEQP